MRKILSVLLALALLCPVLPHARGEEAENLAAAMSFFTGVYGNVAFQLPGMAECIRDGDMDDAWTDNWQLLGHCVEDNAEFQLHMADIAQLTAYFRENFPEDSEDIARAQALLNYGMFMPNSFGAEISDVQPHGSRETGNLWIDVAFSYNDAPDIQYAGRFMLSGTKAVCLVMLDCGHAETVMNALRFVTDAERDKLLAEKNQPTYDTLRGLQMTFPAHPTYIEEDGVERLACFTADWGLIQVQYQPIGLTLDATDEEVEESLGRIAADRMLVPFEADELLEPVMTRPAEHTVQLDFAFVNQTNLGEYGQRMLGRLYAGEYGIWYLYAPENDTGRAFLQTVRLSDEAAPEAADPGDSATEPGAEPAEGAATLPAFRQALEALLNRDNPGFVWKSGNFYWSEPVCSAGEWLRAVYLPEDIGAALIKLDSSAPDAAIREIVMLRYAVAEGGNEAEDAANLAGWRTFARLCCLALRGDEACEEERVAHAESALQYDRVRLLPRGEIPPVREEIPYPDGSSIERIPDSGITYAEFERRFNALTDTGFSPSRLTYCLTQNGARVYMYGEDAVVMVYTDGESDDAAVDLIVLMASELELAPKALEATLLSFAAMTDMSQEEFVMCAYALMETPMWDELCERWPLLCRGSVAAHLQEDSVDGETVMPMGFVGGRPGI